ncbi:hypothetical protein M501DRAFT_1055127 [Patellaria atrata CBS 101060]|uniref:Uncharacterized protein n=1 Tax=Patellaria atrata CBS 101060 TaxID=1346257 RepID=A0A9P4VR00_9PEZI|nr:hypothetical protein M501DRAFT_1055127 [Patellaria atrata CBS 101060]
MSSTPYTGPSSSNPTGTGTTYNMTTATSYEDTSRPVQYACGDCDAKVTLKMGDAIRCKECGHRVLYKERTNSSRRDRPGYREWDKITHTREMCQFRETSKGAVDGLCAAYISEQSIFSGRKKIEWTWIKRFSQ